ncbi:MAG: outer membrane beta-barrel protein [Afipia sp.]|nr:outer membrane beta-barrel protein [Afipia sp.]
MGKFSSSCGASACLLVIGGVLIGDAQAQTATPSDWTGFYVGAHIGNAASGNSWKDASDAPLPIPFAGHFTGGGIVRGIQAGYNYQLGHLVLGVEGEGSFADIDGGAHCAAAIFTCDAKIETLGTVTGRLGYATGDLLFYGKAGGAWLHEKLTMTPNPGAGSSDIWQGRQIRPGLALGAGVEYAFSPSASAKIEYNYLAFGQDRVDLTDPNGNRLNVGLDQNIHLVKLGLNYKLTGAPLAQSSRPSSEAPPSRIWDGIYAGVHTGGTWGTTDWKSATGALATISTFRFPGSGTMDGMIAGAQIGFNRQAGSLVVGGEIDASWSNLDGFAKCATSAALPPDPDRNFVCRSQIDALGTFAGRLGWAHDNLLIYGKAGAAWAKERHTAEREDLPNAFKGSSFRWGYVLGSGVEYAFTPAWSGKVEYNYLDFGTKNSELSDRLGNTSTVGIGQRAHLFKMGLNYRLGVDPTSATFAPPQRASDWLVDVGARYWFSSGSLQKDLYDPSRTTQLNSRLIYGGMNGHSAETFARFDHRSGLFAKGNFGLGTLVSGKLNDEDFHPANATYSNTEHQIRDSSLRYGSLDVGAIILNGNAGKLGAYVGYRYLYQRARGFGCAQIGSDKDTCGVAIPVSSLGLTETEQWRGAAVGLNARLGLSDRWKLEVDAAYLPYANHATIDNHWLRPDINPAPAPGHGWGTQIEAILSYAVTDRLNLGIGGRYWLFATNQAETRFPNEPTVSPLKYTSERYGGFLQASFKLGGPGEAVRVATAEEAPPAHWTGWYVGGHLGAGFGRSDWSDPFPSPPTGDRVNVGGAVGGGQIGVNYQSGRIVVGAEVAGSLSRLEGTETCFGGLQPAVSAGLNCENATRNLGYLTGRLGYAAGQNLFYIKAGGALARETYALNSNGFPDGTISSSSVTNLGWTVGAGVEHALSSRWSVSAEYKYLDFGNRSVDFTVPDAINVVSTETIQTRRHLLTMGVNYRFSE